MSELKKIIKNGKYVIGYDRTMKNLGLGKVKTIFLAKNCPGKIKNKINSYKELDDKLEIVELDIDNKEVGILCKKSFNISVLSVS